MKRAGDIIEETERARVGDQRYLAAADNLASRVLFPDVASNGHFYVHRRPLVSPPEFVARLIGVNKIGEYEAMLLGKLLNPPNPVMCIEGPSGCGKSTTVAYLVKMIQALKKSPEHNEGSETSRAIKMARIDFRELGHGEYGHEKIDTPDGKSVLEDLVREICYELSARCREDLTDEEEYWTFVGGVISKYVDLEDLEVGKVVRRLLDEDPNLHRPATEYGEYHPRIPDIKKMIHELSTSDPIWYLRYLILLWRYWIESRSTSSHPLAFVVLDNLDSLSPSLQRSILDLIMRSAHSQGPTFVLALRPETRMRQGLADTLIEVVQQAGPTPFDVMHDRLGKFVANPLAFYNEQLGLTKEQFALVSTFLTRVYGSFKPSDTRFADFVSDAAGRSIRLGLLLAQGLFSVSVADMTSEFTTQHFLVRHCIRQGDTQFHGKPRSPVENLFNVNGIGGTARLLLKPRILKYIDRNDGQVALSIIRSTFALFGYEEDQIRRALNDLLRHECQLVRSDGFDVFRETWGDEQETLYLTEKGKGYVRRLLSDLDYLQEIMLDCRIDESTWPTQVPFGYLSDKIHMVRLFLRDLHRADREEVTGFVARLRVGKYHELFGKRMVSLDIIQQVYQSVGNVVRTTLNRHPRQKEIYIDIMADFTSLLREVEADNANLIGIEAETLDDFRIY